MSVALRRIRQLWLGLFVIAGGAFVIRYLMQDAERITSNPDVLYVPLAVAGGLQFVFWLFFSDCWQRIVLSTANVRLSLDESFVQIVMLLIGKYLPGKIWGVVARGARLRQDGVSLAAVASATFHEQYAFVVAAVPVCCIAGLPLAPPALQVPLIAAAAVTALLGYQGQALVFRIGKRMISMLSDKVTLTIVKPFGAREYFSVVWRYMVAWIVSGLMLVAVYFALFDQPFEARLLSTLLLANTVAYLAGFIAIFAPAGLGVREATASSILVSVMSLTDAVALSLMLRLLTVTMECMAGMVVIVRCNRRPRLMGDG